MGVEYASLSMLLSSGEGIVKAQIWDTAGEEKYKSITTAHYRKSVGALVFYDLTDIASFKHTSEWLKDNFYLKKILFIYKDLQQHRPRGHSDAHRE